jgi:ABC-type glycerol-3-phosphate transport system substrate-binding protein
LPACSKEWGWTTPALVGEDGGLIAGHARVLAARQLGIAEIPVMVAAGWTEAQKRAYATRCARSRTSSSAFPAPSGPKGRGYMPVLAGLAVLKGAPDMSGAMALIDYLTQPRTQIVTARSVGFFPVVKAELPPDLEPGLKMAAAAIEKMQSAKEALPALLPIGLGQRGGEFDRVFMETFQLVVLRGEKPRAVLDREAETLNRLMTESGAPCWEPDPPSTGACQVQ